MSVESIIQGKFLEACKYNLQLKPGQRLLIFHDSTSEHILNLLKSAIAKSGYDTEIFNIGSNRPYGSVPAELSERVSNHEAIIGFFNYDGHDDWNRSELSFRMQLIEFIQSKPTRYAHAPGLTLDMLSNGSFQCDFQEMAESAKGLLGVLEGARSIHVTAPAGTDFHLELDSGMRFETDAVIVPPGLYSPGKMGNWPPGEVWVESFTNALKVGGVPTRIRSHGRIVCDLCVGGILAKVDPTRPVVIDVGEDGWLKQYTSPDEKFKRIKQDYDADSAKWNVQPYTQELGIGLNDKARVGTGNLLEDEKAQKTCHVAVGSYRTHTDFLIGKPTIEVTYDNKKTVTVMKHGDLQLG
jgi:hypothetical protein